MQQSDLTAVLVEAQERGEAGRSTLDRLVPLVYDELRRMAHVQLRCRGRQLTLNTTGLVHEAYVKLIDGSRAPVKSRAFFFGAASRAMRQVLVDAARRRTRLKRGGGARVLPLDEASARDGAGMSVDGTAHELLELDSSLQRLASDHPRPARVLECRFFGGLSLVETAEVVGVTDRTVQRDWAFACAWLRRELGRELTADDELTAGGELTAGA